MASHAVAVRGGNTPGLLQWCCRHCRATEVRQTSSRGSRCRSGLRGGGGAVEKVLEFLSLQDFSFEQALGQALKVITALR